jgi:hypothetical protein
MAFLATVMVLAIREQPDQDQASPVRGEPAFAPGAAGS